MSDKRGRPLLLRMAQEEESSHGEPTRYDAATDELLVFVDGQWVPAIDSPHGSPSTKKADVETGEDQKDRW
jgi:hypothetical protein